MCALCVLRTRGSEWEEVGVEAEARVLDEGER